MIYVITIVLFLAWALLVVMANILFGIFAAIAAMILPVVVMTFWEFGRSR